jgi:hypothetical protein
VFKLVKFDKCNIKTVLLKTIERIFITFPCPLPLLTRIRGHIPLKRRQHCQPSQDLKTQQREKIIHTPKDRQTIPPMVTLPKIKGCKSLKNKMNIAQILKMDTAYASETSEILPIFT